MDTYARRISIAIAVAVAVQVSEKLVTIPSRRARDGSSGQTGDDVLDRVQEIGLRIAREDVRERREGDRVTGSCDVAVSSFIVVSVVVSRRVVVTVLVKTSDNVNGESRMCEQYLVAVVVSVVLEKISVAGGGIGYAAE